MKTYKEMFKSKYFWFTFLIIVAWSFIKNYLDYGYLFAMEIVGLILGALFLTWMLGSIWFVFYKFFHRNK
jgi:hypothetical protein